jgi:anti-anti-sigma factor
VFSVNQTVLSEAVIIKFSGRLSVIEPAVAQHIEELAADPRRLYIIDLANLRYLDASGIGKLINLWHSIDRQRGRMVVVAASDRIKKLIKITKLTHIFVAVCCKMS